MTFAIVALVVGSFVIYNTFSITVAQRTKETALLRAIGAKRKQVMRSVMLEALFTGVFASAIGVVAGIGMAQGLRSVLKAFGLELPAAATVVNAEHDRRLDGRSASSVTVVAAYLPARKAAKVAPIEALRDAALDTIGALEAPGRVRHVVDRGRRGVHRAGPVRRRCRSGRPGCARRVRRRRGARSGHRPAVRPHRRCAAAAPAGHGRARWPGRTRRGTRVARRQRRRR